MNGDFNDYRYQDYNPFPQNTAEVPRQEGFRQPAPRKTAKRPGRILPLILLTISFAIWLLFGGVTGKEMGKDARKAYRYLTQNRTASIALMETYSGYPGCTGTPEELYRAECTYARACRDGTYSLMEAAIVWNQFERYNIESCSLDSLHLHFASSSETQTGAEYKKWSFIAVAVIAAFFGLSILLLCIGINHAALPFIIPTAVLFALFQLASLSSMSADSPMFVSAGYYASLALAIAADIIWNRRVKAYRRNTVSGTAG